MLKLAGILLGFAVACFSVGISFPVLDRHPASFIQVFQYSMLTCVFAFPGFVILRGAMAMFKMEHILIFPVAGALNALASMAVFLREVMPMLIISGAIAGVVYFGTEWFMKKGMLRFRQGAEPT